MFTTVECSRDVPFLS